jgi:hypothetical protein
VGFRTSTWDPRHTERYQYRERGEEAADVSPAPEEETLRKTAESEEGDATFDLLLRYLDIIITTYCLKVDEQGFKSPAKGM